MSAALTPWSALAGGSLIGLSASLLLAASGRVAGVSGIIGGLLRHPRGDAAWRLAFLLGLIGAGLVGGLLVPGVIGASPRGLGTLALAGLLVGAGTRLGGGCTSGHGVCGIARGSLRSVVATVTFVSSGIVTVTLLRLLEEAP